MYYIVNQTNHIIAADDTLLKLLSVLNMDELHKQIALNAITFTPTAENEVEIQTADSSASYTVSRHTLSSLLGDMQLIQIETKAAEAIETETEEESDDIFSLIDDEPITFHDEKNEREEIAQAPEEEISIPEDAKPFDLISDETPATAEEPDEEEKLQEEEEEISIPEDNKPFDLISDEAPVTDEEPDEEEKPQETVEDTSPIIIDITKISHDIGISPEDYTTFLNEYIDTALTLEEDLKSTQEKKRSHAVTTLSHLSNVLHLPVITEIMQNIEKSSEDDQTSYIQSLYQTLARLTTGQTNEASAATTIEESTAGSIEESTEEKTEIAEEIPEETTSHKSFGKIDLSDVKPIHFDFQLEEAANDLSLPKELIEEFVMDFIDQAHVETEKMLKAYEEGDLDTIQKIGHLLKGTSSNLRINPLADTLYKIQFCEDSSQLEDLIKEYWAHFLSFEHQISIISK